MIVLEIPTNLIVIDEDLYPDQDQSLDFDHLQYYCSKFVATSPLPAIGVSIDRGVLYVTDGQKYVKIARALNVLKIRAYFVAGNNAVEIQNLLSLNGVKSISQSALDDELAQTTVLQGYHVFFFQLPLSNFQMTCFENQIAEFFRHLDSPLLQSCSVKDVLFPFQQNCAEFVASTPVGDPSWFAAFHSTCLRFHHTCAKIYSYQGRRFG